MKLQDLKLTRDNVTVYIDMDGVIADFEKFVGEKIFGHPFDQIPSRNKMFKRIKEWMDKGNDFWGDMDKMPDADQLMNYLRENFTHREILSSTGGDEVERGGVQKNAWIKENYPDIKSVNLVLSSSVKRDFATSTSILIDDQYKSILPFIAAGGIGILHTSAADTIHQLEELFSGQTNN